MCKTTNIFALRFLCKFRALIHLFVFHCNINTSSVKFVLLVTTAVLLFQCNCTYPASCNVNEDLLFGRGDEYVLVAISLIRWNCFQINTDFFFLNFHFFQKVDQYCSWFLMGNMRQYFQIQLSRMFSVHLLWQRKTLKVTWRSRF